jgi:asparagine synthase (glutamine-hydrolysing)
MMVGKPPMFGGVVTDSRPALDRFLDVAAESGASSHRRSHPHLHVAFAIGDHPGSAIAADPDGPIASIAFVPPLAMPDKTRKAKATLQACASSGDPIENVEDQCSVVFWSHERSELVLYRDWRGSPPIYYSVDEATLLWSTSIRELLRLGASRDPDPIALAQLQLVGYVPAPRTMVQSIRKVPAGHILSFRDGREKVRRHWAPPFHPKHRDGVRRRARNVGDIMKASISRMAAPNGPTGVLLSGGIDSVVVLTVAKMLARLDVEAFTFHYEGYEGRYNESPAAKAAAAVLGVRHTEIPIGPSFVIDNLPGLIQAYEEPMTYGIHSSRLEQIKVAGVDVALSGVDAPFFNMPASLAWAIRVRRVLPHGLADLGRRLTDGAKHGPLHRANTLLTMANMGTEDRYLDLPLHVAVPPGVGQSLYRDPGLHERALADLRDEMSRTLTEIEGLTPRDELVLLGLTGSGPEHVLAWNHRWGSAAGVSVRFPLCDDEFVGYMSRRHMGSSGKEDLRMLAGQFLPDDVVRAPKIPQTIPIDVWFRGQMAGFMRDHLTRAELSEEGVFDPDVVNRCLVEHMEGKANHKWVLWTCMTYLMWREHVLRT